MSDPQTDGRTMPIAAPGVRWPRFTLRRILFWILLISVPLTQYPYFWFFATDHGPIITIDPETQNQIVDYGPTEGLYLPTLRFSLVITLELFLGLMWITFRRDWQERRQLQAASPSSTFPPPPWP